MLIGPPFPFIGGALQSEIDFRLSRSVRPRYVVGRWTRLSFAANISQVSALLRGLQGLYIPRVREREKTGQVARGRPGGRGARQAAQQAPSEPEGLRLPHRGEGDLKAGFRGAVYLLGWGTYRRDRARRDLGHARRARRARRADPRGHRDARRHLR